MTNQELIKLYNSDLTSYYTTNKEGVKIWNEDKLNFYWSYFSEYVKLNRHHLENLTFPKFNNHYLNETSKIEVFDSVVFNNCIFLEEASFQNFFIKNISFTNCNFNHGLTLGKTFNSESIDFLENFELKSCVLSESLILNDCRKIVSLNIENSTFFGGIFFENCKIENSLNIANVNIGTSINFKNNSLISNNFCSLSNLKQVNLKTLKSKDYFLIESLKKDFENSSSRKTLNEIQKLVVDFFPDNLINFLVQKNNLGTLEYELDYLIKIINIRFYNRHIQDPPSISIENTLIQNQITIYQCDLSNFSFINTNIEKVNFIDCNWNIRRRLILIDETKIKNDESVDIQYRQLKKIFSANQNWEMSGLAYISEMRMKEERLHYKIFADKKFISRYVIEYFVYIFYRVFGGYAQNYVRPLNLFLVSTFFIFPLTYLFYEPNPNLNYNLSDSLRKSIGNAFPFIKSNLEYKYWYLQSFQIFFSTTLLTFIFLGLRKQFKQ